MTENFFFVEIAQLMNDEKMLEIEHQVCIFHEFMYQGRGHQWLLTQQRQVNIVYRLTEVHPIPCLAPKLINKPMKSKCKIGSESKYQNTEEQILKIYREEINKI